MYRIVSILLLTTLLASGYTSAQQTFTVKGTVRDQNDGPIDLVNISVKNFPKYGTITDNFGRYSLEMEAGQSYTLVFSHIQYQPEYISVSGNAGETVTVPLKMKSTFRNINQVDIESKQERNTNLTRLNPLIINNIPDISGGIEAVLKAMPGVTKNNELSSQYSVRGGSFDENLLYVNDIEVYRPFLIRSGQQEGLSFVNPDMVASILFSAGGFEARYGDKMASVLDIRYKKPTKFSASASASLLGGTAHIEDCSENHRLTHITGIRYKSAQYVLGSLDTKGDYKPSFFDAQTYITYDINEKAEIGFLGNIAVNNFEFVPQTRETNFGTVDDALKLKIYFEGQEKDVYTTTMGAFNLNYQHHDRLRTSYTLSAYYSHEQEKFDILGQYFLNELDKELGSDNMGDSLMNVGVGSFLNHARNDLHAYVFNAQHRGRYKYNEHLFQWGTNVQHEIIDDAIHEWEMLDSAGYSLPYTDSVVGLYSFIHGINRISGFRTTGFVQDNYSFTKDSVDYSFTGGIRANYWTYNNQCVVSPRFSMSIIPNWKRDVLFRFATGLYYQPPFYKELRDLEGNLLNNIRAQRSVHFVLGYDYQFEAWGRPFKMIVELYYKYFDQLVPYQIDNVRVRYLGSNNAKGYAVGLDFKVNGEFVPGVESWASLSVMKTEEDILDDFYNLTDTSGITTTYYPGYIPRPTDQRVNFGLFFQDYLPRNPDYKMHLSLLFGSGLPFGPPKSERYEANFRMPPYRRVDIGFSKVLKSEDKELPKGNIFRPFKSIWLGIEIFNLLDINNTISYQWVSDIRDHQYAVPNYLTSRRLNLRLQMKF